MANNDLPNGFTGYSRKKPQGFQSAADAIRRNASGVGASRPYGGAAPSMWGSSLPNGGANVPRISVPAGQKGGLGANPLASLPVIESGGALASVGESVIGAKGATSEGASVRADSPQTQEGLVRNELPGGGASEGVAASQLSSVRDGGDSAWAGRATNADRAQQPSSFRNSPMATAAHQPAPAASQPKSCKAVYGTKGIFAYADDELAPDGSPLFDPAKLATIPEVDRRWSWVEVDLTAIRHNVMVARRSLTKGAHLCAVVKADAYGHGAVQCARTALSAGADYLAVATVDEGIQLREGNVFAPVLVLSQPPIESIPLLLAYKLMPSVYDPQFAIAYGEAADSFGVKAPYHLALNTGMNRIGVRHDEVVEFLRHVSFHRALDLVGTFTHFATADCAETLDFQIQARRFVEAIQAMVNAGFDPGIVHAANSAATLRYPAVHFDMVRFGIALYGLQPCDETRALADLRPAMSVRARITDLRAVPMSEGVGYGLHYRSPGSVIICTLPIGYADGLRRGLSGRTDVILKGRRFRQVGNICMDQCMFEVDMRSSAMRTRVEPQVGDVVTIVGREGESIITLDDLAATLDTITYELAIGFGCSRMPRIYK